MEIKDRVFIDMDGVLVDFIGGVEKLWGIEIKSHLKSSEYDITPTMNKILGRELTLEEFWKPIQGNLDFWVNLDPLPWYKDVIASVQNRLDPDWYILSSPHDCVDSYKGKLIWIRNNLGADFDLSKVILTSRKELLANHRSILIDDCPANCNSFMNYPNQGLAFLFPAPNNGLAEFSKDPVIDLDIKLMNLQYLKLLLAKKISSLS